MISLASVAQVAVGQDLTAVCVSVHLDGAVLVAVAELCCRRRVLIIQHGLEELNRRFISKITPSHSVILSVFFFESNETESTTINSHFP